MREKEGQKMDQRIDCTPFPLHWKDERMSLKVDITFEPPFSDHSKLMGEASVILAREDVSESFSKIEYEISLVFHKLKWFEEHEGFEVTKDDLEKVCAEVAKKIWNE